MANMLLVTKGTGGDLIPLLSIGSALKARNHHVTLLTHHYYTDMAKQVGLEFVALDNAQQYERFIEDGPLLNSPQGLQAFFRRHLLPQTRSEFEMIQKLCHSRETIIITRHMSSLAALLVAEKLKLPVTRVLIAPSQVTTMPLFEHLCENQLAEDINRVRSELDLAPILDWHTWLSYPQRSIAPWPNWFAPLDSRLLPGMVPVGFLINDELEKGNLPGEVEDLLESGKAPILITSGTGIFLGAEFYSVSAEACRILKRPALLVTRYKQLVPEGLPTGVKWFKQLPFASLIPRVSITIHHGGMCTLARAMKEGIPQLTLAAGADRPDTASYLQRLGVAKFLATSQWKPDVVAEALHQLISSSNVQEQCRIMSERLRAIDAPSAACSIIEELIPRDHSIQEVSSIVQVDASTQSSSRPGQKPSELRKRLDNLSPERHALLIRRLKEKRKQIASQQPIPHTS